MKKSTITMPHLRDTLGDTVDNYPDGFIFGYEQIIREFWKDNNPEVLANPTEVYEITFPGYAVLTMQGRAYKLEFDKAYAAKKGYAETMEGQWG